MSEIIICKFGGTSVSELQCWQKIALICQNHINNGLRPFIVCSAPAQVSNLLETLLLDAMNQNYKTTFAKIVAIYKELATQLKLNFDTILADDFQNLKNICQGIALLNEVTTKTHARVLSFGELMLTKLGAEYLINATIMAVWQDARLLLKANNDNPLQSNYLKATCDASPHAELIDKINALNAQAIITQGFIASNTKNETVLLGRGGSDTSAAYFAGKLHAKACEIWTDVPGIYTANPHLIPEARLLTKLDYDEVQEIASAGSKVLHPNCILPLKQQQIPLYVKYTKQPERQGTLITFESDQNKLFIKSIITKYNVLLISIDSVRMWQQAGFLADIFSVFKKYELSVDLISTSQTNVTVSLDEANACDKDVLDLLIKDLSQHATQAKLIGPCASISLVGKNIRSILHRISDSFAVFEEQQVHLLSQAANDLNLTFVVDEDQTERLAKKLHTLLIEQNTHSIYLSKSWLEEFGDMPKQETYWWQNKKEILLNLLAKQQQSLYVYDSETLITQTTLLKQCKNLDRIFYAMKANPNPEILKIFEQENLNFECVSLNEVQHIFDLFPKINPKRILFTPNFADKKEYNKALDLNINLTVDSLYPLIHWPELFSKQSILIRIDPGHGQGHHKFVCTGGTESKFGIPTQQLQQVQRITQKYNIKIIGLHIHVGSGILDNENWLNNAIQLTGLLELFPQVKYIDLGGGLGIVEKPGQYPLDISAVDASLSAIKKAYPQLEIWLEPGRFLVAKAGVLLTYVTQIKTKDTINFIGLATGMNSLIRPALYGSYHEIVNLTRLEQPKTLTANIVGPICETGDTLGYSRLMPKTFENDAILIANTGAYGYCMSSNYNLRAPAKEYVLFNLF